MATEGERVNINSKPSVVSFINSIFGNDLNSLDHAQSIYDEFDKRKHEIESKLTFADSEAPGMIESAVLDAEKITTRVSGFSTDSQAMITEIEEYSFDAEQMLNQLNELTDKVTELQKTSSYMKCMSNVEDLSSDIQSALMINSYDNAIARFTVLANLATTLQSSKCENLKKFVSDTLLFWYGILKDKLTQDFNEILTAFGWPFIVTSVKKSIPKSNSKSTVADVKGRLEGTVQHLLFLQLPSCIVHPQKQPPVVQLLPSWTPLQLLLALMLEPFYIRFKFHFQRNKHTNKLEKPEWYLTTVLNWIRDHRDFLTQKIQPVLDTSGYEHLDAVVEFSRGLLILVMDKFHSDIPELLYDDQLFSHAVDEMILFNNEMRQQYGYPESLPNILHVLAQPRSFNKWIHIERKYALEKMDQLLSSPDAWVLLYNDVSDVDESKLPQCAEAFVTLMLTITDRYKSLPEACDRLKFVDLQLDLLDDFRIRLLQIKAGEVNDPMRKNGCFTGIMNSAQYIAGMLAEWRELPFFLQLQHQRELQQKEEDNAIEDLGHSYSTQPSILHLSPQMTYVTLFDEMLDLYNHMTHEMLANVVHYVAEDVQARSMPYRKDKWIVPLSSNDPSSLLTLSPSACEMLLVLRAHLHQTDGLIAQSLFKQFWQLLVEKLDYYLYTELVLQNHFNEGGALQVNFDMNRNLFPLFGSFTTKPENHFKLMKESCIVLSLKMGSAMLLKDLLNQSTKKETSREALRDINVHKLSPVQCLRLLNSRTDLFT